VIFIQIQRYTYHFLSKISNIWRAINNCSTFFSWYFWLLTFLVIIAFHTLTMTATFSVLRTWNEDAEWWTLINNQQAISFEMDKGNSFRINNWSKAGLINIIKIYSEKSTFFSICVVIITKHVINLRHCKRFNWYTQTACNWGWGTEIVRVWETEGEHRDVYWFSHWCAVARQLFSHQKTQSKVQSVLFDLVQVSWFG
jgi:hypothetical protein